jgi:hypothetical protein
MSVDRSNPAFITISLLSILVSGSACDSGVELADTGPGAVDDLQPLRVAAASESRLVPEIAAEAADKLTLGPGSLPAKGKCKLDTFQFRLVNDTVAITSPPGGFFTVFPQGIPTFDDPKLENGFLVVVTMRDVDDNIVGFASEQEIIDYGSYESETSYTLTLPDRGTLMLTERESFKVLIDAVEDMIMDQELVRTFDPPIVEVLTLPGTGRVVGGSGEFQGAHGVMQEIGIIYGIDLINNEYDLGVIVQALHC